MSSSHSDIHLADWAVIRIECKGGAWLASLEVHGWCAFKTFGGSYQDVVRKVVAFIMEINGNSYGASFRKRIEELGLDKLGGQEKH